jgi:chromosome partitioning protein
MSGKKGLKTIKDIYDGVLDLSADDVIIGTKFKNLDLIPSSILLHETALKIVLETNRESILKIFLNENKEKFSEYDFIFIDTAPNIEIVSQNAFHISNHILMVCDVSLDASGGCGTIRVYLE